MIAFTLIELGVIKDQIRRDRRFGKQLNDELWERVTKELGRRPTKEEFAEYKLAIGKTGPERDDIGTG